MAKQYSNADLASYLDEALPQDRMTSIELAIREDDSMVQRLATIVGQRDAGVHSLGDIWRRHRLSCPSREQLGSYLLEILDTGHADYLRFHIETIGCRYCIANLEDLRRQAEQQDHAAPARHKRYFESSAGYLSRTDD